MSRNRRPSNRYGRRRILWRVTRHGQEIARGEHHDMHRLYLTLRRSWDGLDLEMVTP